MKILSHPRLGLLLPSGAVAAFLLLPTQLSGAADLAQAITFEGRAYALFPATSAEKPELPSPYRSAEGVQVVVVGNERGQYTLVPVTVRPGILMRPWESPLKVDADDFPTLARTGRHSEAELGRIRSITGRSLAEINDRARPGRLSSDGFIAEDEDVLSVIEGDNRLVSSLGLTHPDLARPLLIVCNLLGVLHRDSGQRHTNVVFYSGQRLTLEVEFTRGGQKSIFDDGLDGAWAIRIRRDLEPSEQATLDRCYGHLQPRQQDELRLRLTQMLTGEMQPFYIHRYGFYEGHTGWRTDPISIAFLFGLVPIEEIEAAFPGNLDRVLTEHFTGVTAPRVKPPLSPATGTR